MNENKSTPKGRVLADKKAKPKPPKADNPMNGKQQLEALKEGVEVHNIHNAKIKRSLIYDGKLARVGFCWFTYSVEKTSGELIKNKHTKKVEALQKRQRRVGGIQVEKAFVEEHGEANVINMIIVNVLNKQKFFKD